MIDLPKSEREFYEFYDKEELIIFLLNKSHENELLRKKLKMITGCGCYGDNDCMNGSCVYCYYKNPILQMKCSQFQNEFARMLKEESKSK